MKGSDIEKRCKYYMLIDNRPPKFDSTKPYIETILKCIQCNGYDFKCKGYDNGKTRSNRIRK